MHTYVIVFLHNFTPPEPLLSKSPSTFISFIARTWWRSMSYLLSIILYLLFKICVSVCLLMPYVCR